MPRLAVFHKPGLAPPREHQIDAGSLIDQLEDIYPDGFAPANPVYYRTHAGRTLRISPEDVPHVDLKPDDIVHCLLCPRGPLGVAGALAVIAIVASLLIFTFLKPARRTEADDNEDTSDSVPDLRTANQLIKPGTRIPKLYGRNRTYPGLATEGYVIHQGKSQELTELYILGEGDYNTKEVKLGDTLLADVEGAGLSKYDSNTRLPNDLRIVRKNRNIENLLLRGPDTAVKQSDTVFTASNKRIQVSSQDIAELLADADAFRVSGSDNNDGKYTGNASGGSDPYWVQVDQNLTNETKTGVYFETPSASGRVEKIAAADDYDLTIGGDTMDGFYDWETYTDQFGGRSSTRTGILQPGEVVYIDRNNRQGLRQIARVKSATYDKVDVGSSGSTSKVERAVLKFENLNGDSPNFPSKTIREDEDDVPWLLIERVKFDQEVTGADVATEPNWTQYYYVGTESYPVNEIWFTYALPGGLWRQRAGRERDSITVSFGVEYQRFEDGEVKGPVYTDNISMDRATRDKLRYTQRYKRTFKSIWRIRWRRIENERLDTEDTYYQDELRILDLAGASRVNRGQFKGVTSLVLRQKSTETIGALSDRRLNVVSTARLQKLQPDGSLGSSKESAMRMSDAFLDTAINDGNYSTANIDMVGLAEIQNALDATDGGDQGRFSFVFKRTLSVDEQLQAIADVARCTSYRIGQKLYLARNEEKPEPGAALFNRRNSLWESYSREFSFPDDNSPDGVSIRWTDQENDYREREYIYPANAKRAKRIGVIGIGNWAQAYRRAVFEYNALRYSVDSCTVTVTDEAQMLIPYDMIRIEDFLIHRFRCGEVLSVADGPGDLKTLTVDRNLTLEAPELEYTMVLRNPTGLGTEEIQVAPGSNANEWICATGPETEILDGSRQLRTLFAFGARNGHIAERWTLNSAKVMRHKVQLQLTNYDARAFEGDSGNIPPVPEL